MRPLESILAQDNNLLDERAESPKDDTVGKIAGQTSRVSRKVIGKGRDIGMSVKRPKHMPIARLSAQQTDGSSSVPPPPPSGAGGDGINGGGGGGGSGKKPEFLMADQAESAEPAVEKEKTVEIARLLTGGEESPDSTRRKLMFSLSSSLSPDVITWLYGYISSNIARKANAEDSGDDEDSDGETEEKEEDAPEAVIDKLLHEWALKNKVEYVEPSGYTDAHNDFVREKFLNHATRKHKITQVREQISEHITILRMFQLNIRTAAPRAHQMRTGDINGSQAALPLILKQAYDMLIGSMPSASRELIQEELTQIEDKVEQMKKSYDRDLEKEIIGAVKNLEGILRYRMEARDGTYRSINLIPDSLSQLLGHEDLDELLLEDNGSLKSTCDYGCADAQLMIMLAACLPSVLKKKAYETAYKKVQERCLEKFGTSDVNKIAHGSYRPIEEQALHEAFKWQRELLDQVKAKFLCIDQAPLFIERLTDKKGLGGVVADLCLPTKEFLEVSGMERGSVKLGISSLTIDRASDVEQLLENISVTLAENGTLVLLTKSSHSAKSDGAAAASDPYSQIEYSSEKDLKGRNRIQLLDHLKPMLERHGLRIERVGRHNGKVISSDVSGNMVQNYKLLAIVCRKTTATAQTEEAPDEAAE